MSKAFVSTPIPSFPSRDPVCAASSTPRPVLITGATGFIGSHLRAALDPIHFQIHYIARTPPQQYSKYVHVADLSDPDSLIPVIASRNWFAIFHLAGLISYNSRQAHLMHQLNVVATDALIRLVAEHCPDARFILMSSVVAVGSNSSMRDAPLTENTPWQPAYDRAAYASTKRKAEQAVIQAARNRLLNAAVLCPSNVYGPRDAKKNSRTTQIKAANGRCPLYTDGGVSIVHVDTVVHACLALLTVPLTDPIWRGSRWLLTGDNITIREMLTMCAHAGGNPHRAPWLRLPYWLLLIICWVGQRLGSATFTMDRLDVATRYHWYDGRRAVERFGLKHVSARAAIDDSVRWMRDNGLVESHQ